MNPRGIGRIERIWTDIRGRGHQRENIADFAFTVMHAGNPIICHAKSIDIGSADVDTKVGDTMSCRRYRIAVKRLTDQYATAHLDNMDSDHRCYRRGLYVGLGCVGNIEQCEVKA